MNSSDGKLPARAWLMVALLWAVFCLNYIDRVMIITMRGSLKASIPMTDTQFGLLSSIFLLIYAVLSPLGGYFADRFTQSRVIIFSLLAWSATTWLTAHASTYGELLASRAVMGISEACYYPAASALIMDYHRTTTRSLAHGIHMSGATVGAGLGGLGGWIAERQGWTHAFELFGFIGVAYTVLLAFLLRDRPAAPCLADVAKDPEPSLRIGDALRSLFSNGTFIRALLFAGMLGLASWGYTGWMPAYLRDHFHLREGKAGIFAMGYGNGSFLIGMVLGGAWADRWIRTDRRGRTFVAVIGLMLAAPGVLLAANAGVLPLALAGIILYGLARPLCEANFIPILCQIVERRYWATGIGVLNFFVSLIGGAAIYAGGMLRDAQVDVSIIFNFGAVGLLACAALLYSIRPQKVAG